MSSENNKPSVSLENLDDVVSKYKALHTRMNEQNKRAQEVNTKISICMADMERVKKEATESFGTSDIDKLNAILFERNESNLKLLGELEIQLDEQLKNLNEAFRQLEAFNA